MNIHLFPSATLAVLTLVSAAYASTPATYPEDSLPELAQILKTVPDKAPELIARSLEQQESTARLKQAKAAYYPRLDLNGNLGYRLSTYSENQPDEDSFGITGNATIRRPLYHWGAIEARIRQARLDFKNENLLGALALRRIQRSIRADYLSLLVNQTALRNARLRRQLNEERANLLRTNAASGTISTQESARTNLNLSQALMDIEQLEADQTRILATYRRNLGWDAPLALDTPVPAVSTTAILTWIEQTRAASNSDWISVNAETLHRTNLVEREKAERVRIIANQRPLFNFAASVGQGQSNTATQNNVNTLTYFAGIDVSWNIFDGFETRQRKLESTLRQRRLENNLSAFQSELAAQAADTLTQLNFQARRLDLEQQRFDLSRDSFASNQRELNEGRLTPSAYREKQLSLQDEELALNTARAALLMGITDYLDLVTPAN